MKHIASRRPLALYLATALAGTWLLVSCGGGGSSSGSTGGSAASTKQGTFIDAPTAGISYTDSPSGLSGTTGTNGEFSYQPGDTITFFINTAGGQITLGTVTPVTPPGVTGTQVFVLTMPNGQQIAQVLQSLNHGNMNQMNVGGLNLSSTDVSNLNNFISSGGQAPGGQTDQQMFTTAQNDAGIPFTTPGGVNPASALANAIASVSSMADSGTPANAAAIVTGNVFANLGFGTTGLDVGFTYFNNNGSGINIGKSTNPNASFSNVFTYTTSGSQVLAGTVTTTLIGSAAEGLYLRSDSSNNARGAGGYFALSTPLTANSFAGQYVTVTGVPACPHSIATYEFSSSGAAWSAYCGTQDSLTTSSAAPAEASTSAAGGESSAASSAGMGTAPTPIDVGTLADNLSISSQSFPDLVSLTGTCTADNQPHYLGLLAGSIGKGGLIMAVVPPESGNTTGAGAGASATLGTPATGYAQLVSISATGAADSSLVTNACPGSTSNPGSGPATSAGVM